MAETVKVGMTGTGGDETFGNYGKYRVMENSSFARAAMSRRSTYESFARNFAWAWRPCSQLAEAVPDTWLGSYRKRRLAGLFDFRSGPVGRYFFNPWYYFSDGAKRSAVFQMDLDQVMETGSILQSLYDEANVDDLRNSLTYIDFKTQLTDEFLSMTDRLSMAHSLEARVPFLDHEFVETVFSIPSSLRTRPDDLKYLLKASVADLLPPEILNARKRGFVIPIKLWLRTSLRKLAEHLLSPERLKTQGLFEPGFYWRYVKPHIEAKEDFTWQVWAALMFQLWHFVFIEQNARSAPTYTWRDIIN
jgi:asparagine synthase (glutamine-hydrolysing)